MSRYKKIKIPQDISSRLKYGVSMVIPFDLHAKRANDVGYHNHRQNSHSDIISEGIFADIRTESTLIRDEIDKGVVNFWTNTCIPWGRGRNTDFVIAEPKIIDGKTTVDSEKVRMIIEHKSVVTAHRNRDARHDDLNNLYQEAAKDERVIIGATVMIGMNLRYLNIPDSIKKRLLEN